MNKKEPSILNWLKWNAGIFISSLEKIDMNLFLIAALDVIFYASSLFLVSFAIKRMQLKANSVILPSGFMSMGEDALITTLHDAKSYYNLLIFTMIIVPLAVIFLAGILKGVIWAKTTKAKLNMRLIFGFIVLNAFWMGFWLAILFLVVKVVKPELAVNFFIVGVLICAYLTNNVYALFMKEHNFKSVVTALGMSISKVHFFLLPYIFVFATWFLSVLVLQLATRLIMPDYGKYLIGLFFIFYIAVVRYYISTLVFAVNDKMRQN